jgi:hypothetical protein
MEHAIVNFTRLILLACWFGAALFFSAVVAPAAFGVLRSFGLQNASEIAGAIVNRSLGVINVSGFVIGLVALLVGILLRNNSSKGLWFILQTISLLILTVATAVGHWVIAARIHALRSASTIRIDQLAANDSTRVAFDSLHGYSVQALGLAMIAALVAVLAIARSIRVNY